MRVCVCCRCDSNCVAVLQPWLVHYCIIVERAGGALETVPLLHLCMNNITIICQDGLGTNTRTTTSP